MKNLDFSKLSELFGFRILPHGALLIVFTLSISSILIYTMELLFLINVPFHIDLALAGLLFTTKCWINDIYLTFLYRRNIKKFIKNLSEDEKYYIHDLCIEERFIHLQGTINPITFFNDEWDLLFRVVVPQYIDLHSAYPIRVNSEFIKKEILDSIKELENNEKKK